MRCIITGEGLALRTFKWHHEYLCFVLLGLYLVQLHVNSKRKIVQFSYFRETSKCRQLYWKSTGHVIEGFEFYIRTDECRTLMDTFCVYFVLKCKHPVALFVLPNVSYCCFCQFAIQNNSRRIRSRWNETQRGSVQDIIERDESWWNGLNKPKIRAVKKMKNDFVFRYRLFYWREQADWVQHNLRVECSITCVLSAA